MNTGLSDRIKAIIDTERVSVTAFAKKVNCAQQSVDCYVKGDRRIPADFLISVLDAYPNLSTDWLLKGEGQMYKQPVMVDDHMTTTIPQALLEAELQKMKESLKAELMAEIKKA